MKSKLYVIDISNFIHRAFHVHKDLTTSKGFPSGAVYGTITMLSRFIAEHQPSYMVICYDAQDGKSVRRDLYPEYKANRVHVNAVSAQEQVIRHLFQLMGVCGVVSSGYEADDLIATVTERFKGILDIVIVTGDKDMLQLVDESVTVFDPMKNIYYNEKTALEKFGVKPSQISDYLALTGDKVDNIPGVRGIGPKAAQELLSQCASVDEIVHRMDSLPPKYQEKLRKGLDDLRMSHELTKLIQVPMDLDIRDVEFHPKYIDEMDIIMDRLEFSDDTKTRVRRSIKLYG